MSNGQRFLLMSCVLRATRLVRASCARLISLLAFRLLSWVFAANRNSLRNVNLAAVVYPRHFGLRYALLHLPPYLPEEEFQELW